MIFSLLIKLILFVSIQTKTKITTNANTHAQVLTEIIKFNKDMLKKRLIAKITMIVITLFFFIYSIIFCSIYRKTQFSWFFGGIWCLFFEWFILGPIYICVLSIIQKRNYTSEFFYYAKRFYCF